MTIPRAISIAIAIAIGVTGLAAVGVAAERVLPPGSAPVGAPAEAQRTPERTYGAGGRQGTGDRTYGLDDRRLTPRDAAVPVEDAADARTEDIDAARAIESERLRTGAATSSTWRTPGADPRAGAAQGTVEGPDPAGAASAGTLGTEQGAALDGSVATMGTGAGTLGGVGGPGRTADGAATGVGTEGTAEAPGAGTLRAPAADPAHGADAAPGPAAGDLGGRRPAGEPSGPPAGVTRGSPAGTPTGTDALPESEVRSGR